MEDKINRLIIETTKSQEKDLLGVYKLVKAEFQKASKSGKTWDPVTVLLGMITTREDSRSQYQEAGREDLAAQEDYEIKVIKDLLPPMPSQEEMKVAVRAYIKGLTRPVSLRDTKSILGALVPSYPGMSGKLVSEVIREEEIPC